MTYRRKGRPSWYSECRTRDGWTQVCWRTPDKRLADKMEAMWETLANDKREWDLLDPVLAGDMRPGTLYDMWIESKRNVAELRRRMNDTNLEPLVKDFLTVHAKKVRGDTLEHIEYHVQALIPKGEVFPRSQATVEYLTKQLYSYAGKPGTIRKVHSDWSVFFAYATDVRGLFERNPMDKVARPPASKPIVRFYELDTVERIVGWQPTAERRALFALLYGTGIEISVALRLIRSDFFDARKEVRAAGTKTHTRDRVARVADWAWGNVRAYVMNMLFSAPAFPSVPSRYTASDWHAETTEALRLSAIYPMRNARHHWAVRALRAGTPIAIVQRQLGHATAKLTLDTYGQFAPSGADRDRWERAATDYETERRTAASTAKTEPLLLSNSRGET